VTTEALVRHWQQQHLVMMVICLLSATFCVFSATFCLFSATFANTFWNLRKFLLKKTSNNSNSKASARRNF
jgi:hypothetical protein